MGKIDKSFYEGKSLLKAISKKNPTGLRDKEIITIETAEKITLPKTGDTWVVKFKEHLESLALNKTNAQTLVKLFGDETDNWEGEQVKAVLIMVNNPSSGGESIGIRLKAVDWEYGDDDEDDKGDSSDEKILQPPEPTDEEIKAEKIKQRRHS